MLPPRPAMGPLHLFLTDPILIAGTVLPFVMLGGVLTYRIRVSLRFAVLPGQNAEALEQTATRWDASVIRTEKMIGLLTEIRDHIARLTPDSPTA